MGRPYHASPNDIYTIYLYFALRVIETAFKLASHQRYALAMMESNDNLGIFYAPGCGKTAIALSWASKMLAEGRIRDVLVVCPASLVGNWESSIEKMAQFEGISSKNVRLMKERIKIVSFQKTYRTKKTPVTHRDGVTTYKRSISLREDVDKAWGAVIIDESHCIGSHKSVQTRSCLALARKTGHRYILTGTPVHGGGGAEDFSKLYGQIKFLEPDIWPNWTQFCNRYVTMFDRWHNPVEYAVESCRALMRTHAIVARLEDCYDMPPYTDTEVPCPLSELKVYKDVRAGLIDQYDLTIENNGGQYIKLLQICSGSLKTDVGTKALKCSKDEALADLLDSTDDKVVVFCNFRASIDRAEKVCRKAGRKVVVYDGRSKGETWREFQSGKADALVAQYQSGGVGIDLYASATMVMYEPCLSALLMEQARARIMRKGQTRSCRYLMLCTPKTIEKKVWDTVRSGVDVTNEMLSKWARETPFE